MTSDPTLLTIAEASALFEARKLSPVELTKACIAKTEALDTALLSYIKFLPEAALESAKSAEAAIMSGKRVSPLQGIPIGLKDIYDTAGVTTTGHSRLMQQRVPAEDATTSRRRSPGPTRPARTGRRHRHRRRGPPAPRSSPPRSSRRAR